MNFPKDMVKLIASYSVPTLWKLSFPSDIFTKDNIHEYLFYANSPEDIYSYISKREDIINLLHSLLYSYYRYSYAFYFENEEIKRYTKGEIIKIIDLSEIKNFIRTNPGVIIKALLTCSYKVVKLEKIEPINLLK